MCVTDQNASNAPKIPIKRRESVPRVMFGTIMNVMRKKSAKMQFMTVKAARISIPGVLVITKSMRRAMDSFLQLHQEKSHN